MARPNPGWQGTAAPAAAPDGVTGGDFAPAPVAALAPAQAGGPVRLALEGASAQVVLSLLVTGDTPGEQMPETAALIVRLQGGDHSQVAMTPPLARCLRGLLVRTPVPREVEDDVAALITSLQLQLVSVAHG